MIGNLVSYNDRISYEQEKNHWFFSQTKKNVHEPQLHNINDDIWKDRWL